MIYECPNCHAPQAAGQTACPECGAEFDGPVPDDAVLPEAAPLASEAPAPAADLQPPAAPAAAELPAPEAAAAEAPTAAEAPAAAVSPAVSPPPRAEPVSATPQAPVIEEVLPPAPAEDLPFRPSSYAPPPAYTPPPSYGGGAQAYTARPARSGPLPKILMIAAPLVLALLVGGLIYSRSLDGGSDSAPAPVPVAAPAAPAAPLSPAAAPVGPPTILPGSMTAGGVPEDPRIKWLAGRWQSKATDFYVFNENGSGSQGSLTGKLPTQDFLWRLVQNQLILDGSPKDQQIRFSVGPDDDTVYLRDGSGHSAQFMRVKP